jgi:hypothetical protein
MRERGTLRFYHSDGFVIGDGNVTIRLQNTADQVYLLEGFHQCIDSNEVLNETKLS